MKAESIKARQDKGLPCSCSLCGKNLEKYKQVWTDDHGDRIEEAPNIYCSKKCLLTYFGQWAGKIAT